VCLRLEPSSEVYNWLVSFSQSLVLHPTPGSSSSILEITANIIQGSALGSASYVVGAEDLKAVTSGNELVKFADMTLYQYMKPTAIQLSNVVEWAPGNNLKSNPAKFGEIVLVDSLKKKKLGSPPPPVPEIVRVTAKNTCNDLYEQSFRR